MALWETVAALSKTIERIKNFEEQIDRCERLGKNNCRLVIMIEGVASTKDVLPNALCEKLKPAILQYFEDELYEAKREMRIAAEKLSEEQ